MGSDQVSKAKEAAAGVRGQNEDPESAGPTEAERIVQSLREQHKELVTRANSIEFSWQEFMTAVLVGAGLLGGFFVWVGYSEGVVWGLVAMAAAMGGLMGGFGYQTNLAENRKAIQREALEIERKLGVEQLRTADEKDFFTELVNINFKNINAYYQQTKEQADKSFSLSCWVAAVGFVAVLAGVGLMYREHIQPGYVTAASGVITEFIAAIFFYLYNRTVLKMSEYHRKLVLTQNVTLAIKISESLEPADKAKALMQLVDRLSHDVNTLLVAKDS